MRGQGPGLPNPSASKEGPSLNFCSSPSLMTSQIPLPWPDLTPTPIPPCSCCSPTGKLCPCSPPERVCAQ